MSALRPFPAHAQDDLNRRARTGKFMGGRVGYGPVPVVEASPSPSGRAFCVIEGDAPGNRLVEDAARHVPVS